MWDAIWNYELLGVSLYHIVSWFFLYSFLGWIWETLYCSIPAKRYINRGFVFGPCITIYGSGALIVYLLLRPWSERTLVVFLGGMLLATVLEYLTSLVMELIYHARWWDYSNHKLNLNGRVCLVVSIGWGIMSLAMFRVLQPLVSWVTSVVPESAGRIVVCVVLVIYLVDNVLSSIAAGKVTKSLRQMERELQQLNDRIANALVSQKLDEATELLGSVSSRVDTVQEGISAEFEAVNEKVGGTVEELLANLTRSRLAAYLEDRRRGFESAQKGYSKRFMKAFPQLSQTLFERKDQMLELLKNL